MTKTVQSTLRTRLSTHFRGKRAKILRNLIDEMAVAKGELSILDVGGRVQYWDQIGRSFLQERNVTVTLLNLHRAELADAALSAVFRLEVGDACNLNYQDRAFDLAHSNSVIEHVGGWEEMQKFAHEVRRVARSYYVQTPYFWFPIDPHFYAMPMFHWFPRPIRAQLLRAFPLAASGRVKGYTEALRSVDSSRLLGMGQFRLLFSDANIQAEKLLGFPKSLTAIRR